MKLSRAKRIYKIEAELNKCARSKPADYSQFRKNDEIHPREARLLKVFGLLEEDISALRGFICGDFLIFFQKGTEGEMESLPVYLSKRLRYLEYEIRRKEHSFYRMLQPRNWSKGWEAGQRVAYEELRKKGLLFSRIMRGAETEKNIVIIHCVKGMGVNSFYVALEQYIQKDSFRRDKIKLIRLTHSSLFGGNHVDRQREFDYLFRELGLNNRDFTAYELEMYISKMDEYAPKEAVSNGWFIVYCPATFITNDPPANFWGIFSAEEIATPPPPRPAGNPGQHSPSRGKKEKRSPTMRAVISFAEDVQYIQTHVTKIMAQVTGLYAERRRHQFLQQARKAAVVAIMSRNMSHNIGSHVLARLASADGLLSAVEGLSDVEGNGNLINKAHVDDLIQKVAAFNSYLRTRMDFLADLATTVPVVTMPKRLYSDVCVYFKVGDSGDVVWQELLMDHISGTNVGKDKITVKVYFGDKEVTIEDRDGDPVFACPNDMLGAHALYTILENIIRNCAKHSKIPPDGLELTVNVKELGDEDPRDAVIRDKYWKIEIYDNLGECDKNDKLVGGLNEQIGASLLKPDGSLRSGGWGLLEMKIAAAYLRKIEPALIDHDSEESAGAEPREIAHDGLEILEAVSRDGNLSYVLYVLKPKHALFIEFGQDGLRQHEERWRGKGLDVCEYNSDEYKQLLNAGANHDFLVLMSPSHEQYEDIMVHQKELPNRVILCGEKPLESAAGPQGRLMPQAETREVLQASSAEQEVVRLWSNWTGLTTDDGCLASMLISDGDRCDDIKPIFIPGTASEDRPKWIFLDRHGAIFRTCGDPEQMTYYEPFQSKSPTGMIFIEQAERGQAGQLSAQSMLPYELFEAAILRVVIVDERVQQEAEKSCSNAFGGEFARYTYADILRWMNIYTLARAGEEGVDLNKQQFAPGDKENMMQAIERLAPKSDFLVVHLGLIEKTVGTDKEDIGRQVSHWEKMFSNVVIISGRGKPSNLPDETRFLHYSLVARYLFEERSKFHLCKVLRSARRAI
jgi:hypothetical protein